MIGRIYVGNHITLLNRTTKYTDFSHCGFREGISCILITSLCQKVTSRGVVYLDHRDMTGRIYKRDFITLLHTKYKSSGLQGFREDIFVFLLQVYGSYPLPWKS